MQQLSRKHHYIPCFYTKRWAVHSGKLVEFRWPHGNIVAKAKPPKGVGFEFDLYTLTGLAADRQTQIEDKFLRMIDQSSSDATSYIPENPNGPFSAEIRSDFARLLMSFMHRLPDRVQAVKQQLLNDLEPLMREHQAANPLGADSLLPNGMTPAQFEDDWRQEVMTVRWGRILLDLIDSDFIGQRVVSMVWAVRHVAHAEHDLLTCDRPVISTQGFAHETGHLALPLSPRWLFLATNNVKTRDTILKMTDNQLGRAVNKRVVEQANLYVFASDERQLRFIERHRASGPNNRAST